MRVPQEGIVAEREEDRQTNQPTERTTMKKMRTKGVERTRRGK